MPSLRILQGPLSGRAFALQKAETIVGRQDDCDLILPLETISRQHARIVGTDGSFYIEDLDSTNGVIVNNTRVDGRVRLHDQDKIDIDRISILFCEDLQDDASTSISDAEDPEVDLRATIPRILASLDVWGADQRLDVKPEKKLRAMLEIIRSLHQTFVPDEMLPRILDGLAEVFPQSERLFIMIADHHGPLRLKAIKQVAAGSGDTHRPVSDAIARQVMREGHAILSIATHAQESNGANQPMPPGEVFSAMCAPLEGPSRAPLGVIQVDTYNSAQFTRDDLDVLASVATLVGQVVEYSREHQAHIQSERLASIGQALASVAHESRNAIYSLQLGLDLLAKKLQEHPDELKLIDALRHDQEMLRQMFEDVRSYAAPIQLERETLNVRNVWRQVWSQLESLHSVRNASLCEPTTKIDLTLDADPLRLEQIFRNLFENALTVCPDPVRIEIDLRPATLRGKAALCIIVRDNGPGLPAEAAENIFEAFFTTKSNGTGLGLAIVKRIVEAHGGRISAESGCGAEFVLTLPRQAASDPHGYFK